MKRRGPAAIRAAVVALAVLTGACDREPGEPEAGQRPTNALDQNGSEKNVVTSGRFNGTVYGASGIAQLPDGRVLVAGDDQSSPLDVVDLFGSGTVKAFTPRQVTRALTASASATTELNDLEALTIDPQGHVYATTSHALTTKGVAKADREQLVRFDVQGNRIEHMHVYADLKSALMTLDPSLRRAAASKPTDGGLNIEGLAWDPVRSRLLIGLRSPRERGDALVVWLENPAAVFEGRAAAVLLPPVRLNLGGEGIRDIAYSPTLRAFVILAGPWRDRSGKPPTLWRWGGSEDPPIELEAPEVDDLKPEGIAEVVVNGTRALIVVSDDGDADDEYARGRSLKNQAVSSRYVILPFDRLASVRPRAQVQP